MKVDVSIIICTYNRCESLKIALESLLKQEADDRLSWKVLVVDNNSNDQTKNVVEGFMARFDGRLEYFFEPQRGIGHARNRGVREALGEIIAFTDDDCLVDKNWVSNLYSTFKEYNADAIGGKILPIYPPVVPAWVKENIQLLCGAIVFHDYGEDIKIYKKPMVEPVGANMAFKSKVFKECGYFRSDLGVGQGTMGEDTEFLGRLLHQHKNIYYCGKALISHPVEDGRMTLKYIAQWNINLGKYRFMIDDQGKIDPRMVYCFGIPRYLIRQILKDSLCALCFLFDKKNFLPYWISLSINWGRAIAMRRIYLLSNTKLLKTRSGV